MLLAETFWHIWCNVSCSLCNRIFVSLYLKVRFRRITRPVICSSSACWSRKPPQWSLRSGNFYWTTACEEGNVLEIIEKVRIL